MSARSGKIARMPSSIREQVNQRLQDGEPGSKIIAWLHTLPEVLAVLDEQFAEEPVSPQNLSEWRKGGYQDWLGRRERVSALKTLSDYSINLARAAGGTISEGAAAIAGGRILELLEQTADTANATVDENGETQFPLGDVVTALVALRRAEIAQRKVDQNTVVLSQRDRQLALEEKKFQRTTAELFIRWSADERARQVVESKGSKEVKMEQLVQLMFGEKPEEGSSNVE